MKNLHLFAAALVLSISSAFASPASSKDVTIDVVPSRYKNLFIFKVDRKFKGAMVEVAYANGEVITYLQMEKRKLIINFCDVKFGSYLITVRKGNNVQEFQYIKK